MSGLIVMTPQQLPRPPSELASRGELLTWLIRVFVCTILPGHSGQGSYRARLPNNLVAFVGLMIHLQEVGFPSHWLTDFLQCIISDNLVTDIAPYLGKWPIPISEINRRMATRKVRLDPWRAELETILVTAYHGIPFVLSLPSNFVKSYTDIGIFETKVQETPYQFGLPAYDPVVSLIFYKPSEHISDAKALVASIPAIFEGRTSPPPGNFFVLTAIESFNLPSGKVKWRLSRERARKMKANDWCMVAYRTDSKEPSRWRARFRLHNLTKLWLAVTQPAPASHWIDVGPVAIPPAKPAFLDILPVD